MCGICGLVSLDGAAVDPAVVAGMNETLVHRGPDSSGAFVEGNVGLAARRLSIIDLAGGDQPVGNEDGRIQVVQNGEIYNHAQLRERLERAGHRFATRSDTEVLVHLYEEQGPAFVEELRGMFAIALWDRLERRLVLARDRFGIKPLYYRVAGGELSFGSELKALLKVPGFSHEVDPDALEAYLAFNSIPAPLTIFAEARKLPPGHMLLWQRGEPTLRRYARPRPAPAGRTRPRRGAARAVARLGACAPRVGRASGRASLGRDRLLRAGGAGGARELLPREHVLDRLRGARFQRARSGPARRRALRHRPP
jgi:asparagine synthase (glutamine-hydrolysing)